MAGYGTTDTMSADYPPVAVNRAAGGFTKDDKEVVGRAVQLASDGSVRLVADGVKPLGSIISLDATKVGIGLGPYISVKQNGTTALTVAEPVTGATKKVVPGGTAERGFVKGAGTPSGDAAILNAKGIVVQSAATIDETEGEASTCLLYTSPSPRD